MKALFMTLILLVGLGLFAWTALRRWKLMLAARSPENRSDRPADRIMAVVRYVFGQARMFRYQGAGIAHAFIFGGFVVLGLRTVILAARGYSSDPGFGFWLFDDDAPLGMAYLFFKDLISVLVIVGVLYFMYLRLVRKPRRMTLSGEGVFILCMILGLMTADLTYEASHYTLSARAAEIATPFHAVTPAASLLSFVLGILPTGLLTGLHWIGFWGHTLIVLALLNFLPYGKHFHIITVIPNTYTQDLRGIGRLRKIEDIEGRIERGETLGVKTARDLSWKNVLDLYTCTECGRCSDHCPAFNTGKLLSPKQLSITLRDSMYRNEGALLAPAASASSDEEAAPAATAVAFVGPDGKPMEGESADGALVPTWVDPEILFACTTCGACEQECPVFISYVDKIVDMRRHLVMERGEFPDQWQNAFRGLETVGNVYSFANEQRADWAAGLDVPLWSEKPDAEYLYWVGCAPSFDDRSRRIARATAQLLKKAGVDFAILGPEETCTGDPARRSGNEYLFQMFATQNSETLNNYNVRKIVTTCPHCFNTLKNEYPEFGGNFEVIHHTTFLSELVKAGRLRPEHHLEATIVFHDSCYLGRYNDVYDAPRDVLRAIPGVKLVEAPQSRDRGMCCGAGGAQMWKEDEPIRRPDAREGAGKVNHARTRQLLNVLPNPKPADAANGNGACKVASACPFCMTMLSDGLRDQGHENIEPLDVAEALWRSVNGPA